MEFIVTIKDQDKTSKHNVICFELLQGIEDFCHDFGIQTKQIVAIVIIDE